MKNNNIKILEFDKDNSQKILDEFSKKLKDGEFKGILCIGFIGREFTFSVSNWCLDNVSYVNLSLDVLKLGLLDNIVGISSDPDDPEDQCG